MVDGEVREVCLPIHQRLRLIQTATGCTPAEARRRLWGGSSTKPDHFQSSEVPVEENDHTDQSPTSVDGGEAADGELTGLAASEAAAQEKGGAIKLTTEAGLVALHAGRAVVCAPGAGIRAFTFHHSWDAQSAQQEVFDAVSPLVHAVLNGRSACVLAYGQTGAGKSTPMELQLPSSTPPTGSLV